MPVNFNSENEFQSSDLNFSENPLEEIIKQEETKTSQPIHGLTQKELEDPNSIRVTIADYNAPLVVLFGPPACGKTMTLVRLTRFLQTEGYVVAPIRTFRPSEDHNYTEICDNFNAMMNSNNAAAGTSNISFMLVEVIKNGRRICQILEAPGEYYFNPQNPRQSFPSYVNTIIASQNRKIWTIMVEPDWQNTEDRKNYVSRINDLSKLMRPKDSKIFIFNKIDKTNFVYNVGNINISAAIREIQNLYPSIFDSFRNQNPITKFWRAYNCDFIPFQTGFYTDSVNGIAYQESPREYCEKLWSSILKQIKG